MGWATRYIAKLRAGETFQRGPLAREVLGKVQPTTRPRHVRPGKDGAVLDLSVA